MVDIGNSLDMPLKTYLELAHASLTTYACISVKEDLIKCLQNNQKWVQLLDYKNTAFQCKIYQQTRHLHGLCSLTRP